MPAEVGIRKAAAVLFQLPLSRRTVRQVVEQGQCIRENKITQTPVVQVHPLAA